MSLCGSSTQNVGLSGPKVTVNTPTGLMPARFSAGTETSFR